MIKRKLLMGCALMLMLGPSMALLAEAHNSNQPEVLTRERGYAHRIGAETRAKAFQCDNLYRTGINNPESGANTFCVASATAGNTGGLPSEAYTNSPLYAVAYNTTKYINNHFDCRMYTSNPDIAGTATMSLISLTGQDSADTCSFSWNQGQNMDTTLDGKHWVGKTTADAPSTQTWDMEIESNRGGRIAQVNYTLKWFQVVTPPVRLAYLSDDAESNYWTAMSSDLKEWRVRDPGSEDRLYTTGGVDITPILGGTAIIGTGVTAERSIDGSDVIWIFTSTSPPLIVSADNDRPGVFDWDVYTVTV